MNQNHNKIAFTPVPTAITTFLESGRTLPLEVKTFPQGLADLATDSHDEECFLSSLVSEPFVIFKELCKIWTLKKKKKGFPQFTCQSSAATKTINFCSMKSFMAP